MRNYFILFAISFLMNSCKTDNKKMEQQKIVYELPENIVKQIDKEIRSGYGNQNIYLDIENGDSTMLFRIISEDRLSDEMLKWVDASNRVTVVNDKELKIIFETDFLFVKNSVDIFGGFFILTDKEGKIIDYGKGQ